MRSALHPAGKRRITRRDLGQVALAAWLTILVGVAALVAFFRWKVSNPLLMAVTALIGLSAFPLRHPAWVMVK